MNIHEEYRKRLRTAEEAVRLVKDGDWVDYSQCVSFPPALDRALAGRKGELRDVKLRGLHAPGAGGGAGPGAGELYL